MSSPAEVEATLPIMRQLRPHLTSQDYARTISRMMVTGFRLVAVLAGTELIAVAGYRVGESLAWGRYLYVDDLVTTEDNRSCGYGKALMDWLKAEARSQGCAELHLDSGVQRHGAHRFYLRERMDISAYHFRTQII